MATVTKIDPISLELEVVVDQSLSPESRSRAIAEFARAEIEEAQRINAAALGTTPPYVAYVDGVAGQALENVNPDRGRILVEFDIVADILYEVWILLYQNSPLGDPENGHYRDNHMLFADGVQVSVTRPPPAEVYTFLNPTSYSRKIELGTMEMRLPGTAHVYERTRQTASRRFGNVATIRFTYESIAGQSRVPALTITPK